MADDATPPILQTEGLSKNFGGLRATRDVSLALHRNELHAVIGPNGAGKSTLVNLLAGELSPRISAIAPSSTWLIRPSEHRR